MDKITVVAVAGPTASGKTRLAAELCRKLDGEVVSADSMQIYSGLRVATARPTPQEMLGVPHHLLGFQPLDKKFSAADYVDLAGKTIKEISERGRLPVVAGGTGLYIRSLLQGINFSQQNADTTVREKLQSRADNGESKDLYTELQQKDPQAAAEIHPNNVKRVVRALELFYTTGRTKAENARLSKQEESPYKSFLICLNCHNRNILYDRINRRTDQMFKDGLTEEARSALKKCGLTASQAIGCKELLPYFSGKCTLEEAAETIKMETRRYAKRQLTWFRREKDAHWFYLDDYADFEALFNAVLCEVQNFLKGA